MDEFPFIEPPYWEVAARFGLALLLGGAMGWEREHKGRPAGLRTHLLVSLGSAGLTIVAVSLLASMPWGSDAPRIDPLRIIQAIIGGIGFLGAGAIIQSRGRVHGLTTAASIWVVSAVGISCGLGMYINATILAVMGLVTLTVVRYTERKTCDRNAEEDVREGDGS